MTDNELQKQWELLSKEVKSLKADLRWKERKVASERQLNMLKLRRIGEAVLFGILAIILMGYIADNVGTLSILIAALTLMIFVMIGFVGNIMQIAEIMKIDFTQPVAQLQKQLGRLRLFNLATLKLVFLSVPFYLAYPVVFFDVVYGADLIAVADPAWIYTNLALSLILLAATIWFSRKLRYDSPIGWIRHLIQDNGGKEIEEASLLMQN